MKSIEIISIPVTDQQRSKEFYVKLGFTILAETPTGDGQTWVQLGFNGHDTSVTLVTWFPQMPPGSIHGFVIKTDSLEQDVEEFTAKGIHVGRIDETPWGKFMAVKDPDGNVLSFHQS
ncbi:VOC family protein [Mucilaginibacter gotjawali]|uniref:Glyoxalase-like domain protein n=2 Tax=Mucilaginibacter gotjawali TaxID=1550579 RepID=A0A110B2J1_9SPHI|nr:VOC family protein [Mucilaginibacter gotjawali]MBB3055360.1 catechol 2,3-dioxygenase-like lactoylglutathione lyase family enzyme [Mucilaginibacter gotjawali]BAU53363.1 Glyoxalase-like domain protein [Mucilaginibacter gotjawali]